MSSAPPTFQPKEYAIKFARVLEAEIRLGNWKRKLLLKVAVEDDIEEVTETFLKPNNIFRRADGFSRISIAVAYSQEGDDRERTLNITISGTRSCNLQSNRDPEERSLGFALLKVWGILSAFEQIDTTDIRAMLPCLVRLHDKKDDKLNGAQLRELGLDPERLIRGGLLERCGRQDIVMLAKRALEVWPCLKPDMEYVRQMDLTELAVRAARRSGDRVEMTNEASALFLELRVRLRAAFPNLIEMGEERSVSYHDPDFFLEVIPRRRGLGLLVAIEYNEIETPDEFVEDTSTYAFVVNAAYQGGVLITLRDSEQIDRAFPIIVQARSLIAII